jgi:hypothetical protein
VEYKKETVKERLCQSNRKKRLLKRKGIIYSQKTKEKSTCMRRTSTNMESEKLLGCLVYGTLSLPLKPLHNTPLMELTETL